MRTELDLLQQPMLGDSVCEPDLSDADAYANADDDPDSKHDADTRADAVSDTNAERPSASPTCRRERTAGATSGNPGACCSETCTNFNPPTPPVCL